jgi:hypothetical protein
MPMPLLIWDGQYHSEAVVSSKRVTVTVTVKTIWRVTMVHRNGPLIASSWQWLARGCNLPRRLFLLLAGNGTFSSRCPAELVGRHGRKPLSAVRLLDEMLYFI